MPKAVRKIDKMNEALGSKLYSDLEIDLTNMRPSVKSLDAAIEQLIRRQTDEGFGFPDYWDKELTLGECHDRYVKGDAQREGQFEKYLQKEDLLTKMLDEKGLGIFRVIKNLWRPLRRAGFPGTKRKGDPDAVNEGCFLDLPNISVLQKGVRVFALGGLVEYVFLVQPFPILPAHVTLAYARHTPQILSHCDIDFFLDAALCSTEFRYAYNSIGAGATIDHLHFHVFEYELPVEDIEVELLSESDGLTVGRLDSAWPILTLVFEGEKEKISSAIWKIIDKAQTEKSAFNILSVRNAQRRLKVYFIPRKAEFNRPKEGGGHAFGIMEMGGLIIAESTQEFEDIEDPQDIVRDLKTTGSVLLMKG